MAVDPISYDKSDLRGIVKAFKAMDETAVEQAKGVSNGLATYVQSKIIASASGRPNKAASRIAQGSRVSKSSKLVNCHLALCLRNLAVAVQLNSFGAVTNLALINTSNFRCGRAVGLGVDQLDISSIQPCAPNSHISFQSGKMHLLRF
jgi:hypothetical protein